MDRRSFVFGSIQSAVAFGMANSVKALPSLDFDLKADRVRELISSPIFSYADFTTKLGEQRGWMLHSEYRPPKWNYFDPMQPEMAFRIESKRREDARLISSSVRGTESRYIHSSPVIDAFDISMNSKDAVFIIERAANSICRTTLRGRGNHLIVPRGFDNLHGLQLGLYETPMGPKRFEIITDIGIRNGGVIADNVVYIFYRGPNKYDVPGILFQDGAIALNKDYQGDEFGYGRRIIFKPNALFGQ